MNGILYSLGWLVLAGMAFVAVPVVSILAINLLTGAAIPITFFNWLATLWLTWAVSGSIGIIYVTH